MQGASLITYLISYPMYELFIELTNQIFWDGYAENLALKNPAAFRLEYAGFLNDFNY